MKSSIGEDASGCRNMLFGVNTTSGFRQCAQCLAAQQMKILRCIRRLANLKIISRRQLQKTLDACAGMLRALAFVTVRQEQNHAREQIPFVLAGADELIDHRLGDIDEVAELRLPEHQRLRIVAAVAVLEAQHTGFR